MTIIINQRFFITFSPYKPTILGTCVYGNPNIPMLSLAPNEPSSTTRVAGTATPHVSLKSLEPCPPHSYTKKNVFSGDNPRALDRFVTCLPWDGSHRSHLPTHSMKCRVSCRFSHDPMVAEKTIMVGRIEGL